MVNPMIGQTILFAGNFAPRGWAFCEGQLLQISQNTALFSILGTTYGGDGRTTFKLPDLRGRVPVNVGGTSGTGPGLRTYVLGQQGGTETHTLLTSEMPAHGHTLRDQVAEEGDEASPVGNYLAGDPNGATNYKAAPDSGEFLATAVSDNTGLTQSFNKQRPYLGLNYIIALFGTYPSRN